MKNLLFIMSNLNNGGAERSLVNLLQLLDYEEYSVDLILFQNEGMFLKQVPSKVNIIKSEVKCLHSLYQGGAFSEQIKKSGIIKYCYRAAATIFSQVVVGRKLAFKEFRWKNFYGRIIPKLKKNYDTAIAYLHGEPIYYLVDKVNAQKKIGWVHNEYTKTGLSAKRDLPYFESLSNIVTISDICAEKLVECFPEQSNKIVVIPNLTSSYTVKQMADEFYPSEYDSDGLIFVSIGRLHAQKGFDMAIDAACELKNRGVSFTWYILGSGELEETLKQKADKLNISRQIRFIGSRANPYPYIKNADILIQPSRYEGKSIVLDEAKILAKPIVATNYDTVKDQLSSKEGIIVDMNSTAIADGIEKMAANKEKYTEYLMGHEYGNTENIAAYNKLF